MLPQDLLYWVDQELRNFKGPIVPGIALAVIDLDLPRGEQVEFHCWGNAKEEGQVVDQDTIFSVASCSKAFNATSIGISIASKQHTYKVQERTLPFSWDTKVKDVLPDFKLHQEAGIAEMDLKVRDLLCHRSGLPAYIDALDVDDTVEDVIHKMRYCRPTGSLRERFQYDNRGIILSAHILQTLTSKPISHHTNQNVFLPLGMTSSTYSVVGAEKTGKLSQAFELVGSGRQGEERMRRVPFWLEVEGGEMEKMRVVQEAPGGVLTSVMDMSKWIHCFLLQGKDPKDPSKTIIPQSVYEEITKGHQVMDGRSTEGKPAREGGLGWFRWEVDGHEIVEHGGGQQGVNASVNFLPNDKFGIIILSNTGYSPHSDLVLGLRDRIVRNKLRDGKWQMDQVEPKTSTSTKTDPLPTEQATLPETNKTVGDLAGLYHSDLFGSLRLHTAAEHCKATQDFSTVTTLDDQTLYASISKFWYTHLWLKPKRTQTGGREFRVQLVKIYPHGHGIDKSPIFDDRTPAEKGIASFVFDENGGVKGMAWRDVVGTIGVELPGETAEEKAEIWFKHDGKS